MGSVPEGRSAGADLIHPLTIGGLRLADNLALAPMAGYTNLPFRLIVKEVGGCGLVANEMVAAIAGPTRAQLADRPARLQVHPAERPVAMQIYGREPELCAELARCFVRAGADLVDLNCGCSVRKALRAGCGVSLMREPRRVERIIAAVRAAVVVPVTAKLRLGYGSRERNAPEVARAAVAGGADALFVHARTGGGKHAPELDWAGVAPVREAVGVPLYINGDLRGIDDLRRARQESGADGFQIGRAACGDPWIFRRLAAAASGHPPSRPTTRERRDLSLRHFDLLAELHGERCAAVFMRKCAGFYCQGLPGVRELRRRWARIGSRADFSELLDGFFAKAAAPDAQ